MPSHGKIAIAAQCPARLRGGRLAQPLSLCVDAGRYWLTRLKSRPETPAMTAVKEWLRGGD
jgi:hypothetical protein